MIDPETQTTTLFGSLGSSSGKWSGGALGRTILTRTTADQVRGDIGLGTAATRNVGTGVGNLIEVGAFGVGVSSDTTMSWC